MKTLDSSKMQEVINDIYSCASCGYCRFGCPVFQRVGFERLAPRGRILALKRALESRGEIPETLRESIYMCLQCQNCQVQCPMSIDFPKIALALAEQYNEANDLPEGPAMLKERIAKESNPFGEPRGERGAWMPKRELVPGLEHLYFVGCGTSYSATRIARSIVKMLDDIGFQYNVLGAEENCCGAPLFRVGDSAGARKLIEKNVQKFKELGVKTIFANCAGCFKTLKHAYPDTFEALHVTQFLMRLVESGQLKFSKDLKKRIIYFDGCDIGRHSEVYEEPRELLKSIPGVELLEYEYNRDQAMCCGGPLLASYPDLAQDIAADRVREAVEKGAEIIATACPTCMVNLKRGAQAADVKIRIEDIPMLLPTLVEKNKK
ncbi:MAG: (Fe-S)-binding protein [Candidatus Sumerlaeota bacterium]|nr:(Fe-S)-binding protein [Candidatus Sumerlaeota bacterium]